MYGFGIGWHRAWVNDAAGESTGPATPSTCSITCAAIARLLILEFGIAPRRPDWEAILAACDEVEHAASTV
jgi:hypothetical protein